MDRTCLKLRRTRQTSGCSGSSRAMTEAVATTLTIKNILHSTTMPTACCKIHLLASTCNDSCARVRLSSSFVPLPTLTRNYAGRRQDDDSEGSDTWALKRNFVSVTPLKLRQDVLSLSVRGDCSDRSVTVASVFPGLGTTGSFAQVGHAHLQSKDGI